MLDNIGQYLIQAPTAVILIYYIYISDKQKTMIIESLQEQNNRLINVIENYIIKIKKS